MSAATLTHDDYTVGWISPLEVEEIAALEMLDEQHVQLPQPQTDHNAYYLGSIYGHNVVIAGLPKTGNCSTATVVAHMTSTFRRLRFGLLVGIGGGVPTRTAAGHIRLGHVVVSQPTGQHSGALQYDRGKAEVGEFRRTGFLPPPPNVLLNAARRMGIERARAREDPLITNIDRIETSITGLSKFKRPRGDADILYEPDYVHHNRDLTCRKCRCSSDRRVTRNTEDSDEDNEDEQRDPAKYVVVHRGTIATGEKVMRNGCERDQLAKEHGILCFEMEAAGALDDFPCLVVRGISDYSDSHKNDKWHGYAAAAAAAYARELFRHMPIDEVKQCKVAESVVKQIGEDTRFLARSAHESNIRRWLNPPDPSANHNQARKEHHPGTGLWFLQSEQYRQWKTKPESTLWLYGIPGCGKSVLSSTVIEDLKKTCRGAREIVLYFYFNFNDSSKQTFESMVRSLCFQLYQQHQGSQKYLEQLCSSCMNGNQQPEHRQLCDVFYSMLNTCSAIQIVLDALDECTTRKELLFWLPTLEKNGLKVFLTSRREEDIESSLSKWMVATSRVPIQQKPVDEDIRALIHSEIASDKELQRWQNRPEVCTEIELKLMENAGGMFRWAVCQLDVLRECLDLPSLEDALTSLPQGLDETYERILNNILDKHKQYAIRLLQFLTFSERPLRLEEAIDAIVVFPDRTPAFDERHRMPQPREITRFCSSLVSIVNHEIEPSKNSGDYLQLAHFSVKEYLVSKR
ncbi:purine and uridine phosphorylase, partial [Polychaeton citri CBS 116435]